MIIIQYFLFERKYLEQIHFDVRKSTKGDASNRSAKNIDRFRADKIALKDLCRTRVDNKSAGCESSVSRSFSIAS